MVVQINTRLNKVSDQFHENKMEIENLTDHNDKFSIGQFLSNNDLTPDATAFVSDELKKLQEPQLFIDEEESDNDKSKELLRYVITNQERMRDRAEEAQEQRAADRQDRQIERERRAEAERRERLEQERVRIAAQRERERNDRDDDKARPAQHVKKTSSTSHSDYSSVSSAAKHIIDNPRDAAGDAVEAIAGKETRQFGGKILRAEFGAAVEQVAGKETRETLREVKKGVTHAFNVAADTAVAAKDAAVDTAVAAKNTVVNTASSAWSSVTKLDLNPFS